MANAPRSPEGLVVEYLFVYGTLTPGDEREIAEKGWVPDQVFGRLYDFGAYPGIVDVGDETADLVEGYARRVTETELVETLDPYEEIATGPFRRVVVTTRSGLLAWIYEYGRPIPEQVLRRGTIGRSWRARRSETA